MKLTCDTEAQSLVVEENGETKRLPLYTPEAFAALSRLWVSTGWSLKYSYQYAWLGRPIIQLPDDMVRMQELLYALQPDVLVETGVAHGGSLVFYASLFKLMGKGKVVGVDVEIRPHNRRAIEAHELFPLITLIEGSSTDPKTVAQVRALIPSQSKVLVVLDSNHTKAHVSAELEAYAPLVTPGSYVIVADGVMAQVHDVPGGKPEWRHDNPSEAVREFVKAHPEFEIGPPAHPFDESKSGDHGVTYFPVGYLRRTR